jgi:hypothetical protein
MKRAMSVLRIHRWDRGFTSLRVGQTTAVE